MFFFNYAFKGGKEVFYPDCRDNATMICLANNIFIYGGKSNSMKNNLIYLNVKTQKFNQVKLRNEFPEFGRVGHTALSFNSC